MRHCLTGLVFALILFSKGMSFSQETPSSPPRPPSPGDVLVDPELTPPEVTHRLEREQEKKANHARHVELKKDTDKLLELSTQLKQYVDKTNEDVLSLDVVKKADEIEKLAHSVKEKMKGAS